MSAGERRTAGADELMVLALARGMTYAEAGAEAGCSEATVRRRMGEADVRERVHDTRAALAGRIAARLVDAATTAVSTLVELTDAAHPPAIRLRAAQALLAEHLRHRELVTADTVGRTRAEHDRARAKAHAALYGDADLLGLPALRGA